MATKSKLAKQLDRAERILESLPASNQVADPAARDRVNKAYSHVSVRDNEDPAGGFKSFKHFLHDVRNAGVPNGSVSKALQSWHTKAASGLNEGVGSEGGFLVPPEFSMELMRRTYDNSLLEKCTQRTCAGNSLTIPTVDETSRANGSRHGGVISYWEAEAGQFTASKPSYGQVNLRLKKLTSLCYVTDELLQDAGIPLQQHLMDLFAQELKFRIGDALINGTGAGQPLGVLNSPCLVTVSKETGQSASTLLYENIVKMWQRMYAPSRDGAIWLINQDVEHQLNSMYLPTGITGTPVYLPPGGLNDSPRAKLMGRDVVPVEFCQTLGTLGDILLVDLSQMIVLRKGETQTDSSIHLRFDFNEVAFRTIVRVDSQPWWVAPLTPFKGQNTLSCFIGLASRS